MYPHIHTNIEKLNALALFGYQSLDERERGRAIDEQRGQGYIEMCTYCPLLVRPGGRRPITNGGPFHQLSDHEIMMPLVRYYQPLVRWNALWGCAALSTAGAV